MPDAEAFARMVAMRARQEPLEALKPLALSAAESEWCGWTLERQLWYLRKKQKRTQSEFAGAAGLTQAQLSRIEGGEDPRWSVLHRLFLAAGFEPLLLPGPLNLSRAGMRIPRKKPAPKWYDSRR